MTLGPAEESVKEPLLGTHTLLLPHVWHVSIPAASVKVASVHFVHVTAVVVSLAVLPAYPAAHPQIVLPPSLVAPDGIPMTPSGGY